MSAKVLEVRVSEGTEVKTGDPLCLLSAMKMETVVSSPVAGTVSSINVSVERLPHFSVTAHYFATAHVTAYP